MKNSNLFFILILSSLIAVFLFWSGFHNVDLAFNAKHSGQIDCNFFLCQDLGDFYLKGLIQIQLASFISMFQSAFFILYYGNNNIKVK